MSNLVLSSKYKAFLHSDAPVEFLEGTTAAGKTTVGGFKFILKVADSPKKIHILSGLDLGTIEKNIINKDLGICDLFGELVEYNSNGKGENSLPHIVLHVDEVKEHDKIIYVLGYDNKARWKKALGGQYGCLYIDEINIADMEYVREASMRCDYLLATLNPDDPNLPIYKEYINHSRPLSEWEDETPKEILRELQEEPKPGWVHWFFSFEHNSGLTPEKIEQIKQNVPKGTKLYKNKIKGLRGKATGLVFPNFDYKKHVKSEAWARQFLTADRRSERFIQFTSGLDTAYSQKSPDEFALTFSGITSGGKHIQLEEKVYNNTERVKNGLEPLAPSDLAPIYKEFLDEYGDKWGLSRYGYVDSADQATLTELYKLKRNKGVIYIFTPAWKELKVIDRIKLVSGWIQSGYWFVLEHCVKTIHEYENYSWDEKQDNTPEDRNDHCINSGQYGWIPYRWKIGDNEIENSGHDKKYNAQISDD